MIKKKIFIDSILNIIATAIPVALLQIVILPFVGIKLGDEKYGLAVTLISMATLFSLPFGNVLNNIRLLMDNQYKEKNISGDFNLLLLLSVVFNSIIMVGGTIYYEKEFNLFSIILIVVFSSLNLIREYMIVSFRLILNYKAILVNNIILGVGYLMGTALFYFTTYWQLIYVIGSLFSLIYILKNSTLIYEGMKKTIFFKEIFHKNIILFLASFMKNFTTYADKLILFPLLGATSVSIYYASTVLGKIIAMAVTPITGVMLSYLVKIERINLKTFIRALGLLMLLGIGGYIIVIFISKPVLMLLYPAWARESLKLVYVTTATVIVETIATVIRPVLIRFNNLSWQLIINFINLFVYTICVYICFNLLGLLGFCVGMLLASLIKVCFMILILAKNT